MLSHLRGHVVACAFLLTAIAGLSPPFASARDLAPDASRAAAPPTASPARSALDFCPIYPLALPAAALAGATSGQVIERLALGTPSGAAWLTWSGDPGATTLARSLVPPGDSDSYQNPDNASDHRVDLGDWVLGVPGNANASGVQAALTALVGQEIVLPVSDESRGQGSRLDHHVVKFVLVRLTAADLAGQGSVSLQYLRDYRCYNVAPVAVGATPTTLEDTSVAIVLQGSDANNDALTYSVTTPPSSGTLSGTAPNLFYTPTANFFGDDQFQFRISDGELESATATVRITVLPVNDAPVAVDVTAETDQGIPVSITLAGSDVEGDVLGFRIVEVPTHGELDGAPPTLRYVPASTFSGADSFRYVANDGSIDSLSATVAIQVHPRQTQTCNPAMRDADHDGLIDEACVEEYTPANPSDVAPPNDPSVFTGFLDSFGFLAIGPDAIQRGVSETTILPKTAALLRGRVLDGEGQPLPDVLVRIVGHPEFGFTYSRSDGYYDLLVNGGGTLNADFQRAGYLRAQRQASNIPWQGFGYLDDVALVPIDVNVERVSFGATAPPQLVQGSVVSDDHGLRNGALFIPAATSAVLEMHDGSSEPMGALNLRITEYTVGEFGPQRMPSPLPASSGYTYAVELSADEAITANAKSVVFSQPAAFYVDNFLNLPVGMIVPTGFYDHRWSAWRPSDNGRVIRILGVEAGQALVDLQGAGQAATTAELSAMDFSSAELTMLASTYPSGKELWRSPIAHLTPWDCNFPYMPPADAVAPEVDNLKKNRADDDPEIECGSIIGCQNSSLGESIPVAGAPFSLRYQSNRAPGYEGQRRVKLTLKNQALPPSLRGARVTWNIAGASTTQHVSSVSPGQTLEFQWDGKDAFGRTVYGNQPLSVSLAYIYDGYVAEPAELERAFAWWSQTGLRPIDGVRTTFEWSHGQTTELSVDEQPAQLGGWGIDLQHSYDMKSGRLARGDGTAVAAAAKSSTWGGPLGSTAAVPPDLKDGDHVSAGRFDYATDVIELPDGTLLVADDHKLWRIGADGIVRHFAGDPSYRCITRPCYPAPTDARLIRLEMPDLAVDKSGCVFVHTLYPTEVLRICNGWAETVWVSASRNGYGSIALTDDGRLFVHEYDTNSIYQLDAYAEAGPATWFSRTSVAGIIDPSGWGRYGYSGNDGPASNAVLGYIESMTAGPDGSLYLAEDKGVVRRIDRDGIIRRVAGRPSPRCDAYNAANCSQLSGVGGPALDATFDVSGAFSAFLADGTFVFNGPNGGLLALDPAGILVELGPNNPNTNAQRCQSPAANCYLGLPLTQFTSQLKGRGSVTPEGRLLVSSGGSIQSFETAMPTFGVAEVTVADERGVIQTFDAQGRHQETRDPITGRSLYRFEYDNGALAAIVDSDGHRTRIERDAAGVPRAIVAHYGQRTELELDPQGDLAVVRDPLQHEHRMTYFPGGLLKTFQRPDAAPSAFLYDGDGRLQSDVNPLGKV